MLLYSRLYSQVGEGLARYFLVRLAALAVRDNFITGLAPPSPVLCAPPAPLASAPLLSVSPPPPTHMVHLKRISRSGGTGPDFRDFFVGAVRAMQVLKRRPEA